VWPEIFTLELFGFSLPLRSFGLLVAIGFLVALSLAQKLAVRYGADPKRDPERFADVGWWILIGVIAGGRCAFVLVNFDHYGAHPLDILKVWEGGLVMYGGLIGAMSLGIWKAKRVGLEPWRACDYGLTAGFLGQAIGRLGCLAVGDDYGKLSDLPWAITFPNPLPAGSAFAPELAGMSVHPTQPYMTLKALSLFFIGLWLLRNKKFHGQVTASLFALYGLFRGFVEFFRGDDFARGGIFKDGFAPDDITAHLQSLGLADPYGRISDIPRYQEMLREGAEKLRPELLVSTSQMVGMVSIVLGSALYLYLRSRKDLRIAPAPAPMSQNGAKA